MTEKRRFKRSILVSYFDTVDEEDNEMIGYLADISQGGMLLISKEPIATDRSMSLVIDIPEEIHASGTLRMTVRSIRCMKDPDFSYFNTGFVMEQTTPDGRLIIDKLIETFEL
jgi:hypothetical protein